MIEQNNKCDPEIHLESCTLTPQPSKEMKTSGFVPESNRSGANSACAKPKEGVCFPFLLKHNFKLI